MTKLITRLITRSILLRNTIQNSTKNQQQLRFYEKKVSQPARYFTVKVVKDKIANSSPINSTLLVAFVVWSIYFIFNGIETLPQIAMVPLYPSHLVTAMFLIEDINDEDVYSISTYINFQSATAILAATKKGQFCL